MSKKVFKTKIDAALPVLIVSGMIPGFIVFVQEADWTGLLILIIVLLFSGYLLSATDYTIYDTSLKIRSGFLVNKTIPISSIRAVVKTDSLLSAPAGSISDRIEVQYNQSDSVIISPKEKGAFINELLKINSAILVKI